MLINHQIEPLGRKMMAQQNLSTPVVEKRILSGGFLELRTSRQALARFFVLLAGAATAFLAAGDLHAAAGTASTGQPVTLSVSAQGTAPFVYQWYKNGTAIGGGTNASYTIASTTINDSGTYFATVRNGAGATTSDSATLTVIPSVVVVPPPVVAPPPPVPNTVSDSGFESVRVGSNNFFAFQYNPTISNWTFTGNAGIAGNNSGFTSSNSSSPEGSQVAFVQMQGSAAVRTSLSSGRYVISAMVANRANWGGSQTVLVSIDGVQVGRFAAGTSYTLQTSSPFNVGTGVHTLLFAGQASNDSTLFLDQVNVVPAPSGSTSTVVGGFETPVTGSDSFYAFRYNPPTAPGFQDWNFQGFSGVTGNNSGFTSQNPNAPEGKQVAFLQMNNSAVSRTISLPATGSYQIVFAAAQRANYNQSEQVLQVFIDNFLLGSVQPHGGTFQTFTIPLDTAAGSHQLMFKGTVSNDSTVLLDQVNIVQPGT